MKYWIRVTGNDPYWHWCKENLTTDSWLMVTEVGVDGMIYKFVNAEDATAFRLRFGL